MSIHTAFFASLTRSVIDGAARHKIIEAFEMFQEDLDSYRKDDEDKYEHEHIQATNKIKQPVRLLIESKLMKDDDPEAFVKSLIAKIDSYLKIPDHQGFAEACRKFLSDVKASFKKSEEAKGNCIGVKLLIGLTLFLHMLMCDTMFIEGEKDD